MAKAAVLPATAAQRAQSHLATLASDAVTAAWPLLDPHDIKGTAEKLGTAVYAAAARLGAASAAGALQDYRHQRAAAGVPGAPPRVPMPPPIAAADVTYAVTRGLAGLYGPVTADAISAARTMVQGDVSRLVLDQGRRATIDAVTADPKADGWARVLSPGACSFCAMVASRLGAYRSRSTADFAAHPNCHCTAQPVFKGVRYAVPPDVARADALWRSLPSGVSGASARLAFRQAWEGRAVTAGAK
jgi:hypothetical protein